MTVLRNLLLFCPMWSLLAASVSAAESASTLSADIGPRPVAEALAAFGRQTGLQLIYVSTIAETQQSKGAHAELTVSEALAQLLDGTGLRFEFLNARTVRIFPAPAVVPTAVASLSGPQHYAERHAGSRAFALEEVVVTDTRREEQLKRVPIDMAVWTQEAMEASGVKGVAEIGALTPGVEFDFLGGRGGDEYTNISIRGVDDRHGATVGIYLDDTPVPPARTLTYLRSFPVTFDLDRVEVLRGPQGTLLGDHTQAGAVRFIMNQPSLTTFMGLARSEWGATAHGAMSFEAGAAVGGPVVTDVLGFRVSGWYRSDGGYVDRANPFTGATVDTNANAHLSKSFRGALTVAPEESVRITPSLIYQSSDTRDTSTFFTNLSNPGAGVLRNAYLLRQPFNDTFYLASLKLTAGLRVADLSALTSYFDRTATLTLDEAVQPPDVAASYFAEKQRVFSQEVRLTSADPNASLTWVAGTFFSSEHTRHLEKDAATGITDLSVATLIGETQLAGFGQLALRMTQRLTASAGLRIGRSRYNSVAEGPLIFHAAAADTWMTPRFVLSYQADEHKLLYLAAAKGYGSGGVYPGSGSENAAAYPPDALWSYEIGSKNDLLGGRMHLDTSVFHIRWNNGPPSENPLRGEYSATPGTAVSNGLGLTVQALLTERVRVGLGIAYAQARHTQTLKVGGVVLIQKGDGVYGSNKEIPPWNVTASIEREFPMRRVTVNFRAEDVFHSRNAGPFNSQDLASPYSYFPPGFSVDPATNVLNIRAAVRWSGFDVTAFVNNALGSQPTLQNGSGIGFTLTPRTLGLSGTWRF